MNKLIYKWLANTDKVKYSRARACAAVAFNRIIRTDYEQWDYKKDGSTNSYIKSYATYEEVYNPRPIPKRYIELLASGKLVDEYPNKKTAYLIQDVFNEELTKHEWIAINHVYWDYHKKFSHLLGEVPIYFAGLILLALMIMGFTHHL